MSRFHSAAALALLALLGCVSPSASAAMFTYQAFLDGPSEFPPNASPGTGFAIVTYDDVAVTLRVQMNFSDLIGTTTAAHIHGPTANASTGTAGVITTTPTFTGFPLGVTSGNYDHTFDLTMTSSFNPSFVTDNGNTAVGATAALLASLNAGTAYIDLHTTVIPGGEIRGFLALIPEPATAGVMSALIVMAATRRTRHRLHR